MLLQRNPPRNRPAADRMRRRAAPFSTRPDGRRNWILVGVGAILALVSLHGPALLLGGRRVDAVVTSVRETSSFVEYQQQGTVVGYAFTLPGGGTHYGSFSQSTPLAADVPRVGDVVPVRYLARWPALHSADGPTQLVTVAVFAALAGAVLVYFGLRRPA